MSTEKQRMAAAHARSCKEYKRLVRESNKSIEVINSRMEREGRSEEKFKKLKYNPND